MGLTEFLIAFSIVMLMLSFVSERVSNFLKLHFQNRTIFIFYPYIKPNGQFKWGLKATLKILGERQPTVAMEKEREYRVMTINIIVGLAIATFTNANFFQIVERISKIPVTKGDVSLGIITGWKIEEILSYGPSIFIGGIYLFFLVWSLSLIFFNRLQEVDFKIDSAKIRKLFIHS